MGALIRVSILIAVDGLRRTLGQYQAKAYRADRTISTQEIDSFLAEANRSTTRSGVISLGPLVQHRVRVPMATAMGTSDSTDYLLLLERLALNGNGVATTASSNTRVHPRTDYSASGVDDSPRHAPKACRLSFRVEGEAADFCPRPSWYSWTRHCHC